MTKPLEISIVIPAKNEESTVKQVIHNGLSLLGVSAPESM